MVTFATPQGCNVCSNRRTLDLRALLGAALDWPATHISPLRGLGTIPCLAPINIPPLRGLGTISVLVPTYIAPLRGSRTCSKVKARSKARSRFCSCIEVSPFPTLGLVCRFPKTYSARSAGNNGERNAATVAASDANNPVTNTINRSHSESAGRCPPLEANAGAIASTAQATPVNRPQQTRNAFSVITINSKWPEL